MDCLGIGPLACCHVISIWKYECEGEMEREKEEENEDAMITIERKEVQTIGRWKSRCREGMCT